MISTYDKMFASFFQEAADAAGELVRHYFRHHIPVDDKDDSSPVTEADREIEKKIRSLIEARFPTHGIIGEEFEAKDPDAEFVWVIDPIDGTKSFITGRPLFGTIIGLMHNGVPVAGLIDQAFTMERWFGVHNAYATLNGQQIRVAPRRNLEKARLFTGGVTQFEGINFNNYIKLCKTAKVVQYGCDCYGYGLVAMGWADVCVEQGLKLHDVAGIAPIITGAGGFFGDWHGRPIDRNFKGFSVAASTVELAMDAVRGLSKDH